MPAVVARLEIHLQVNPGGVLPEYALHDGNRFKYVVPIQLGDLVE